MAGVWGRAVGAAVALAWGLSGPVAGAQEVGQSFRDCSQCPEMVVVPAGSFVMGAPESEAMGRHDERPQHRVTIPEDFAVGKYEVTRRQYAAFVSATGYTGVPNQFGLYDMLGNVWEWTQDCANRSYTGAPANGDAWAQGDCNRHVMRGGAWDSPAGALRSANRCLFVSAYRVSNNGFRVAKTL